MVIVSSERYKALTFSSRTYNTVTDLPDNILRTDCAQQKRSVFCVRPTDFRTFDGNKCCPGTFGARRPRLCCARLRRSVSSTFACTGPARIRLLTCARRRSPSTPADTRTRTHRTISTVRRNRNRTAVRLTRVLSEMGTPPRTYRLSRPFFFSCALVVIRRDHFIDRSESTVR